MDKAQSVADKAEASLAKLQSMADKIVEDAQKSSDKASAQLERAT